MHELSIALSIVDECANVALSRGSIRVTSVYLKLGQLSGVVEEALRFSFGLACEGTALEGSRLLIEHVPVTVYCPGCEAERVLPSIQLFRCPICQRPTPEVVRGRELEISAIEIEESEAARNNTAGELQEVAR